MFEFDIQHHLIYMFNVQYNINPTGRFKAVFGLKTKSESEFQEWMEEFQQFSYITWRVRQTFNPAGKLVIFRVRIKNQNQLQIVCSNNKN